MQRLKQASPCWPSIPGSAVMPGRGLVPRGGCVGGSLTSEGRAGGSEELQLTGSILCRKVHRTGTPKLAHRYVEMAKRVFAYVLR